ncbi:hypothetical protein [Micromonospora sp. NPDC048839]|uniref:hypothetical protein n=1 Tax=Micromonospora sp. NPDC048839 TaxID=3155641 RepID=UPI0033DF30CA
MRIKTADAGKFIANLCPFTAGNLRGDGVGVLSAPPATGALPAELAAGLRDAQMRLTQDYLAGSGARDAVPDAPAYIVSSYGTPIAWVTHARKVVIPDVTYSSTTTRHQRVVREALAARP